METSIKTYKRKMDRDLRHIKLILSHARHQMTIKEWLDLVQQTKGSILLHPEEYISPPLPDQVVLTTALDKIFNGFLEDQRLLALQTSHGFRY